MYIYIIISSLLSIFLVSISYILNKDRSYIIDSKKLKYECGQEDYIDTNIYTLLYYKIAITYLVFDIETVLLFPTAFISSTPIGSYAYLVISLFILILILGLLLEYFSNIYD